MESAALPAVLLDPVREALSSSHRHLAVTHGQATRYPAAVAPFAAVADHTPDALANLRALLAPGEAVFLISPTDDPLPSIPGLRDLAIIPCLQMVFPENPPLPSTPNTRIHSLSCADSPAMVDLITLAYPGYFRSETCRMGRYVGIHDPHGTLIAMGGERLVAGPWHEISGICSHPAHAGGGLGTAILLHLLALHRAEASRSWLWVTETNRKALGLYARLGFQTVGRSLLHRMQRSPS